ncbi:MAG TPA: hypothetical protein DCW52_13315 [Gammaproteobacteria bacterium]|nr:hypothetical protein [Gammaproteobacteria bacterium]
MSNGRIRGVDNNTSLASASGIYTINEVSDARSDNKWPFAIPSGCMMYVDAGIHESYSGSGTTWFDLSGQGNDCEANGNPTHTSGAAGAFALDGNDYFKPPDLAADSFTAGITIFSVANFGTANNAESLLGLSSSGGNDKNAIQFYRDSTTENLRLRIRNSGGTSIEHLSPSSTSIENSTVKSYAATLDGVNGDLYANGVNCGTKATSVTPSTAAIFDAGGIGLHDSGTNRYLTGDVAVMLLFNRGLSAAEILDLHNYFATRYSL